MDIKKKPQGHSTNVKKSIYRGAGFLFQASDETGISNKHPESLISEEI